MTGAYFYREIEGKSTPVEVEYLTTQERYEIFKDKDKDEIIEWLDLVCDTLIHELLKLDEDR